MLSKSGWLAWLVLVVHAQGNSSPGALEEPSLLGLVENGRGVRSPASQWSHEIRGNHRLRDDNRGSAGEGASHAHAPHSYGSALMATGSPSDRPRYSFSSQEYWRPGTASANQTGLGLHAYSGLYGEVDRPSFGDAARGSHPVLQYQQIRATPSKKIPPYFFKGKLQVAGYEGPGTAAYKKTVSHQMPPSYKKTAVYPRVHRPYAKHKYPAQKTVLPFYGGHRQSPYGQRGTSATELLLHKSSLRGWHGDAQGYRKVSSAHPTPASDRRHTTERMDDARPDGQTTSADYSAYNDTYGRPNESYYESYEEVDKTTSEPREEAYDEATTRGYYGDRIYMSTQVPADASDKSAAAGKYYLVRRTPPEDDIETIFE